MKKQTIIKVLLLITIISIVAFADTSFAQSDATDEKINILALTINFILSVCSRIWIVLANLAGQFLSNDRVYGAVIGMDRFLRLCRNVVKNLANFMLGAVFIFYLFKALFFQEEVAAMLKNILLKILVAGVGIQASWFIVAATLDISTIATSAVGSLPAQLIHTDTRFSEGMKDRGKLNSIKHNIGSSQQMVGEINKKLGIDLFPKDGSNRIKSEEINISSNFTEENVLDLLTPNASSLAGPLVFLGVSILDTQTIDSIDLTTPRKSLINVVIASGGIIIYTIAMFLLTIVAFLRIIYLWAFIVLSPLLILLFCLKEVGSGKIKEIDGISEGLKKSGLSIQTFLNLAFKPAIITLGISLALIFTVLMKSILTQQEQSGFEIAPGNYISSRMLPTDSTNDNQEQSISFDNATLQITVKGIGKSFGDIILTIITLVFMRIIIKTTIINKIGIDMIDNFGKNATKFLENVAGNTSFIPIGGKTISYNSIMGPDGIKGRVEKMVNQHIAQIQSKNEKNIDKVLGADSTSLYADEYNELERYASASNDRNNFSTRTKELSDDGKYIGLYDEKWTQSFITWMDNANNTGELSRRRKTSAKSKDMSESLEAFFKNTDNIKEYWKTFGGNMEKVPPTFGELKKKKNFKE